jgi:superfamily I DNA/RNA helicase
MRPDASQLAVIAASAATSAVVTGAPGTGKTETMLARLIHLVQSGACQVNELLVLTPTRQTATRLRDRLGLELGVATPGAMARSIGSFAFQVIAEHAASAELNPPKLLTGADQDRVIAEILASDEDFNWPAELSATLRSTATFRTELRDFLAECTAWQITGQELRDSGDPRWQSVAAFLERYDWILANMYPDHHESAELLSIATEIVRDQAPRGVLDGLRVLLIDDAQELTRSGLALVRALQARGVAVMAFGDPDIGSGVFRGASSELFRELSTQLGEAFVLRTGYRTTKPIRAVVDKLTQAIGAAGRVDHRQPEGEPDGAEDAVQIVFAASAHEELDLLAATLRQWHLGAGVAWQELAVIAHDSSQVARLEAELAAREVPTSASGVQRPLGSETIVRELAEIVLLGLSDPADRDPEELERALLSSFGGMDAVSLRRLRARLRQAELKAGGKRAARELLQEAMAHPATLDTIGSRESGAAEHFAETLHLVHNSGEHSAHELLWLVWDRAKGADGVKLSKALEAASARDSEANRALDALVALFAAAKRAGERAAGEPASVFLRDILDSAIPEDSLAKAARLPAVRIMTPAAAVGTEFERVIIAGVQEGTWPNVRLRGALFSPWALAEKLRFGPEPTTTIDRRRVALHDEIRLFARAVSRARSHVMVTAVRDEDLTPSAFFALLPPESAPGSTATAGFALSLRGLVARHRRTLTTSSSASHYAHAAEQLAVLARAGVAGADPSEWYGMLEPTTSAPLTDLTQHDVRVSPSQIENFEECALNWVIAALGGKSDSIAAGVGTVMHAAAQDVPHGGRDDLARAVQDRWGDLEFEADWVEQTQRKRAELLIDRLEHYFAQVAKEQGEVVAVETSFELELELDDSGSARVVAARAGRKDATPKPEGESPRAILAGAIDRVEVYPPGKGEKLPVDQDGSSTDPRAVIVDLKTGKSEKRIADNHVTDHAQLSAYQLAFAHGAVPAAAEAELGAARLLLIGVDPLKNQNYRLAQQLPLDESEQQAFIERVARAAHGMAGREFIAHVETHCVDASYAVCRIHTIGAVSSA